MYQLRKGYEVDVTVTFTDDIGNAATVDGVPEWAVSVPAFTVVPSTDGMSAVIQGTGTTIGDVAQLTLTADADLGDGITPIVVQEDLQLISGTAAIAEFGFGDPRPITT